MEVKTLQVKTGPDEFAKARELIEIRGTDLLTLQDRRIINVLYANAGSLLCHDVTHVISISELRGNHKGKERVRDSIMRLMKTIVAVPSLDQANSTKQVAILSDTTITDDEDDPYGKVIYSFSPGMRAIIRDSTLWGKVRNAVVFAFTSKYALALYELVTARVNMKRVSEAQFSVEDLRALLGVKPDQLLRVPNLLQRVIGPAVLEVNGLAEFGVAVEAIRTGGQQRGFVTGFLVSWWRKDEPELRAAYQELKQAKVGRMARLKAGAQKPLTSTADAL
jgi:hypothetical protein